MFVFSSRTQLRVLLEQLTAFQFELAPYFDLEDAVPLHELGLWSSLSQRPGKHAIAGVLRTLVQEGPSYEAGISLRQIAALNASCGSYLMHLDRLPETMRLREGESFGPLCDNELKRLESAVFAEFRATDGRFAVSLQRWDGLYIGANTGASRRFALWRRLTGEKERVQVPAKVTPYGINMELFRCLREEFRAIGIRADMKLHSILQDAGDAAKQFAYFDDEPLSRQSQRALLVLPYPHLFPKQHIPLALALHRRLDRYFDLGRYLAESMSLAEMKRNSGSNQLESTAVSPPV